jgi:hypothetical protein
MPRLLRYEPWDDGNGNFHVNDCTDLKSIRGLWWVPARMLGISPAEYVELLIVRFKVDKIKYLQEADVLIYSWNSLQKARDFKNWLNQEARKRQYVI